MRGEPKIYFHSPCFDGMISCVLAWEYLETDQRWPISNVHSVNYDLRSNWLNVNLGKRSAVLDFLYHPSAVFWADHHSTTFVSPQVEADCDARMRRESSTILYNPQSGSTASLLWKRLNSFFVGRHRLQEMMQWADKIDAARYDSVNEAILGDTPALRINFSLMLGDTEYCEFLVRQLRERDLKDVAELPQVAERFADVRKRLLRGLNQLQQRILLLDDGIAAFDVDVTDDAVVSRYAPYHFIPNARYSIGIFRNVDGNVRITAMRNPWLAFESLPLGGIFERYGGGGHQRVASVVLSGERAKKVEQIADEILKEMRHAESPAELREAVIA